MFLRNVCVALGNSGDPAVVPAVVEALGHPEELVRGHAAWALGELGSDEAIEGLKRQFPTEQNLWVRAEISSSFFTRTRKESSA
jgi:epoxyqueuosine reductase